ncbi:uL30 family ribosomal protein [Candidatus Woesearchaeota archaeon]|nr:uL30 family ribosomal protein [Candidatus Woesearchaeota archaeon]
MADKIAVILVRGLVRANSSVQDTLYMLRLRKKNHCVIVSKTPQSAGMINKVKDYVTWGEIDAETITVLQAKMKNGAAHLQPPRKGFGRKGIKVSFSSGGALGYRGEKINDLIKRMV